MNIQLQKFDMRQIKDDKVVVLIGKRDTGKSFLVRDLLYYHQDVPIGTVISGTEGANAFYSNIFPSLFILGEYNPGIISNYMKRQKLIDSSGNLYVAISVICNNPLANNVPDNSAAGILILSKTKIKIIEVIIKISKLK